ncbi:MAG: EamA family transporter, partial [Clostridiales bacterium]
MKSQQTMATLFALLAAALYAISSPISKLLLEKIPPTMMAALLYLGAGIGLFLIWLVKITMRKAQNELPLTKK